MGKNKKKKAQMFSNFLAFKAGQGNQIQTNTKKTFIPSVLQKTQLFQTPHGDQEKLTELLDDNSPNVEGSPGAVKPGGSGTSTNPARVRNLWKPVDDTSNIFVNMKMASDPNRPNLTVVEGTASKIQLVMDKSKKIAQPSSSPKEEESRSTTPSLDSYPGEPPQQLKKLIALAQSSEVTKQPVPKKENQPAPKTSAEKESPPQNKAQEQTEAVKPKKKAPSWILASNKKPPQQKPVWQPQPISTPPQANTGSGWPKSLHWQELKQHQKTVPALEPLNVQTEPETSSDPPQAYSPSDVYSETVNNEDIAFTHKSTSYNNDYGISFITCKIEDGHNVDEAMDEDLESPEMQSAGTKRLSAFKRLGPVAEQPKKTKLTINLLCQKDVRNVVDETDDIPTHQREYITSSTDEIVVKYLDSWPFKTPITPARIATTRVSKSVMILETEYMEECYARDNRFILVMVTGYPQTWKKEDVLDALLESVKGKSFIPCFIEFSRVECKFLVIRCRLALLAIHKFGFIVRKGSVELIISVGNVHVSLNHLDFVPRLILRKLMSNRLDGTSLDLSEFTLKNDISHFVYFPLYRLSNQTELVQLQSTVPWECLTSLDLSRNKITTITSFDLVHTTPKLRNLNLSYNCIEKATSLLPCRYLPLKSIHLEGNPLCNDYIEQEHYIQVLTMIFSGLVEIDGVLIKQLHDLPDPKRNYCPEDAKHIVDKLLEVLFPLLDASKEQRFLMEDLYHEDAVMTITFMYKLRYGIVYKDYRNLFNRARVMDEGEMESIVGSSAIVKVINRWPDMLHDPTTFTVDVLYHSDTTTILRIGGIVKITAESLADDEHLLSFTRTLVLHSRDGIEYKITNELLYWDIPEKSYAETAFKITRVKPKNLNLRLDAPPDEDLKEKLLNVFMQITELEKKPSERCLEAKDWNIKNALEYFTKLLKLDNLNPILGEYKN